MLLQAGIAAPHPPHVLTRMTPLVPSYGDLTQASCWMQLIDDTCSLVERNPVPWSSLTQFDRKDIANRCRNRTLVAILGAMMDTYAEAHEANAWVCKSMQYSKYGRVLDAYFGTPKYIYLYRDGRDVTLSFTKAVVGEKHPYHIAKRWDALQRVCLAERERVGSERYFSLCYEELTGEPEPVLRALCDFLSVEFRPEMLSFHRSAEARSTSDKSQLWQNLNRPIMRNNSRKFLKGLTEQEIRIVETVAGDSLEALGYELVHTQDGATLTFSPEDIASYGEINDERKASRRAMLDEADAERRHHQLQLLTERVYFLKGLSQADALRFLAFAHEEHYNDGDLIIAAGDTDSRSVYFLISGQAAVILPNASPHLLGPGEPFGELACLTGRPRSRDVLAKGKVRLFCLPWERWNSMRTDAPDIAASVLWAVSKRLAERFMDSGAA